MGINSFTLTLDEDVTLDDLVVLDTSSAPSSIDVSDGTAALEPGFNRSLLGGIEAYSEKVSQGLLGSARGSFFGIEAGGHEFVYVLDVSGSMQGRRFDRASEELLRSVEQLGPHQRF